MFSGLGVSRLYLFMCSVLILQFLFKCVNLSELYIIIHNTEMGYNYNHKIIVYWLMY